MNHLNSSFFKNLKNKNLKIHLVETGLNTMTGGRLKKFEKFIFDEDFILTYGDGLSNVNLKKLVNFHKKHKKVSTVTAVHPPGRFGNLDIKNNFVTSFNEKHQLTESWINGGFFIFKKEVFKYLKSSNTVLELDPMKILSKKKQLMAYKHEGFWHCVDTRRDRDNLENILKNK